MLLRGITYNVYISGCGLMPVTTCANSRSEGHHSPAASRSRTMATFVNLLHLKITNT